MNCLTHAATANSLTIFQNISGECIVSTTSAGCSKISTFRDAALQANDPITSCLKLPHTFSHYTQFILDGQQATGAPTYTSFPLSSDHLIHLIHFNVFRALLANKSILNIKTVLANDDCNLISPLPYALCDGLTLIYPKASEPLPQSLIPTPTQMTIPHTSWLNMFPYPQLRDNLIFHQNEFSHVDFCNDLWGEFFLWNFSGYESSFAVCPPSSTKTEIGSGLESDDDDLASGKRGLIVWGEPWDLSGWEVTEGFVRKWSWLLEGCIDVFVSSNFWRAKRDLEPLAYPYSKILGEEI
ncbi:hypothetical protein HYFRA_00008009 [Hymenoscyphus fraxineus]|uniref:Uncharacterized protein n=1 Tax=Hymenoscyphus fraxineus TaxID=746836 RepID=A0A9N9PPP6_9HELO|nr:hypothetical protein HYFRA_00008009 [Hymenoscyphus fraxineus]